MRSTRAGFPPTTALAEVDFGNNGAGGNHSVVSDRYTGMDDCAAADPDITADCNGLAIFQADFITFVRGEGVRTV